MMTIFKRIFASIIRKPFKSILLVLTIFVLGSFVGASYSIYQATQNVDASIKNNLDTYAVLRYNAAISGTSSESIDTQNELSYLFSVLNKKETVVDSNINPSTYSYLLDSNINHPNSFITNPFFINYVGLYGIDPYHNLLIGNSNDDLKKYYLKITEGRNFTKEDYNQKKYYVLINELNTYVDGSQINIGDILPATYFVFNQPMLSSYEFSKDNIIGKKEYQFEVIGKYTNNSKFTGLSKLFEYPPMGTDFIILSNVMNDIKDELNELEYSLAQRNNGVIYKYDNSFFKLDSVESINDFIYHFNSLTKNENISLITTADGYLEIRGTLNNMNLMAITILVISCVASVLVGMMIIYLFLKDRRKEVGILIAMGETKKRILATISGEIVILGLVGLLLSVGGGHMFGKQISNDILQNQLQNSTVEQLDKKNYKEEIIKQYEIKFDQNYLSLMLAGGCLVLAIASAFPIISIMRLKPKDILL